MKALIFDIQRFSIHDGPGIRTAVFLKGCPLRCFWCHNPEGISPKPQLAYIKEKCRGCGMCIELCPARARFMQDGFPTVDGTKCALCGLCAEKCLYGAISVYGRERTVDDVMDIIARDEMYYKSSGGGVTLSGGEPLLQADFCSKLLERCKDKGYHTAIETCGFVPWGSFEKVLPFADLFLYDIKAADAEKHIKGTGQDNALILENLKRLAKAGKHIIARVPVIPQYNDDVEAIRQIALRAKEIGNIPVQLMPFHAMASGKYESLGMNCRFKQLKAPSTEQIDALYREIEKLGIEAIY